MIFFFCVCVYFVLSTMHRNGCSENLSEGDVSKQLGQHFLDRDVLLFIGLGNKCLTDRAKSSIAIC